MEQERLLIEAAQKDPSNFAELYEANFERVYAFIVRRVYASVRIGDSIVGVSEAANNEWMRPMQSTIYMYVPDCDALYQQALRAGATSLAVPADHDYGDRNGGVKDAWGNVWYMATPL